MAYEESSTLKPDRNEADWPDRTVTLVGLMGAGKSTVGRRLAQAMGRDFYDSDDEIEKAAGLPISEIFALHGEAEFRRGEQKVLARLLSGPPHVLATGGGAYLNPDTRALLRQQAVTVWLAADLDTLWKRVSKRSHRPLLRTDNPRQVLSDLFESRKPIYDLADIKVNSIEGPHGKTVSAILDALKQWRDEHHD
jgi:shikimate kinase